MPTFPAEFVAQDLGNANADARQPVANHGEVPAVLPQAYLHVPGQLAVGRQEVLPAAANHEPEVMNASGGKNLLVEFVQEIPYPFGEPVRPEPIPLLVHHFR